MTLQGYCPHGKPHIVTTSYGWYRVIYLFTLCREHGKECGLGTSEDWV